MVAPSLLDFGVMTSSAGLLVPDLSQVNLGPLLSAQPPPPPPPPESTAPRPPPRYFPELARVSRPTRSQQRARTRARESAADTYRGWLQDPPPALFVWTETAWFDGDLDDLRALHLARQLQTLSGGDSSGPSKGPALIRLDVILHPYQLYQTRVGGGDGLVVFPELLSVLQLQELLGYAGELKLWIAGVVRGEEALHRLLAEGCHDLIVTDRDPFSRATTSAPPRLEALLKEASRWFSSGGERLAWGGLTQPEQVRGCGEAGATGAMVSGQARARFKGAGPA